MADLKTTEETTRSPIDGSELVRLATTGANWKATLSNIISALVTPGQPIPTSSSWAIGTLLPFINTGSTVLNGNTTAGSNLKLWVGAPEALSGGTAWANASMSLNSSGRTTPSGTWKNVTGGSVDNSNTYTGVGFFVRTA